jgi:hypothetical protein
LNADVMTPPAFGCARVCAFEKLAALADFEGYVGASSAFEIEIAAERAVFVPPGLDSEPVTPDAVG